ncbi:MAG: VOC family protein [SAR202 cluster bacterium]|nr:VOC family protein [SAR202 cluster bacterium]
MAYEFDHVHIKSTDPGKTAEWYVKAFNFKILSDATRMWGDRFIRCETVNGTIINISGSRTNEKMGGGDASAHYGIEHFGIKVDDMDAEIKRLIGLGAKVMEGPIDVPNNGPRIAFIMAPEDVRIELMQYRNK